MSLLFVQKLPEYKNFLDRITSDQLEVVAKTLRGNSSAASNCVHLAKGMIAYLVAGKEELPREEASIHPSTAKDFSAYLYPQYPQLKAERETQEQPRPKKTCRRLEVAHSTVFNAGVLHPYIPLHELTFRT